MNEDEKAFKLMESPTMGVKLVILLRVFFVMIGKKVLFVSCDFLEAFSYYRGYCDAAEPGEDD